MALITQYIITKSVFKFGVIINTAVG
jgi:hypothetical protein